MIIGHKYINMCPNPLQDVTKVYITQQFTNVVKTAIYYNVQIIIYSLPCLTFHARNLIYVRMISFICFTIKIEKPILNNAAELADTSISQRTPFQNQSVMEKLETLKNSTKHSKNLTVGICQVTHFLTFCLNGC